MNKALLIAGSAILIVTGGLSAQAETAVSPKIAATAAPVEANSQAMEAADQIGSTKMNIRQQIQSQLAQNGYSDVTIMPSSFFIRAKDKQGNAVEMILGPDTFTEVTEVKAKTAAMPNPAAPAAQGAGKAASTPAPKT